MTHKKKNQISNKYTNLYQINISRFCYAPHHNMIYIPLYFDKVFYI